MSDLALSPGAAALVSLLLSAGAIALVLRCADRLPQARATPRSLHDRPVPRVGGLAIWAGFLPVALLAPPAMPSGSMVWLLGWLAVAAVSALDDWRGVPPAPRLAVQTLAAAASAATMFGAGEPGPSTPAWMVDAAVATLLIVWSSNLFNFMDGTDGLAAAMTVFGFGSLAAAAALAGAPAQACIALTVAGAAFLAVNAPPARAFMGDVGAVPLGFLAAVFGIAGWRAGTWPAWFPLLVFLPFLADATLTLGKRFARGERVWQAHKTHYYQRLHQLGAGHRGTLVAYGAAMAGVAATALAVLVAAPEQGWWALAAWTLAAAALFARIDYHWNRKRPAS